MKKQYIQPALFVAEVKTISLFAASEVMDVKGDYGNDNEEDNGGAGILSRGEHSVWEDEEEEEYW